MEGGRTLLVGMEGKNRTRNNTSEEKVSWIHPTQLDGRHTAQSLYKKKVTVLGKLGYTIRGAVTKNDLSFPRVEREFSEGQRTRVFEKLETPKSRTLESVIYELCYDQQRKKNKGCF